jgi:hypothetical protein
MTASRIATGSGRDAIARSAHWTRYETMHDLRAAGSARLGLAFLALLTLTACMSQTSGPTSGPTASAVTAEPSIASMSPAASASPTRTPEPTAAGSQGATFDVDLVIGSGRTVTIEVKDESGRLVSATSGTPGDGASVPLETIEVTNDDPSTLRLTWAGPPCATDNLLLIEPGGARMTLVQKACTGDAIAFDRILVLTFSEAVSAEDVEAIFQAGGDTPA